MPNEVWKKFVAEIDMAKTKKDNSFKFQVKWDLPEEIIINKIDLLIEEKK